MFKVLVVVVLSFLLMNNLYAQEDRVLAFPGAEGYGAYTAGGRGGKVYVVTNLEDAGPGTLREAGEADGKRIVVFNVSGVIDLQSPLIINNPYSTIAAQTAPGQGVCLKRRELPFLMRLNFDGRNNF